MTLVKTLATAVAAALALGAQASGASTFNTSYDFSTVQGVVTPTTLGGATFSSAGDAADAPLYGGSFQFATNAGLYSTLGNYVLSTTGNAQTLNISFAQAQNGLQFNFAVGDFLGLNGGDTLTVTANTGQSWVVNGSAITLPSTDLYTQGLFSVANATTAFTSVTITASDAANATDTLVIAGLQSNTVPLPGSVWLLAGGLAGLVGVSRRVRTA